MLRNRQRQILEGRDDAHAAARRVAHDRGQRVERHARNRRLTGRVDVGQHDFIGGAQRRAELAHQLAGASVAVRLEHDDDAPVDAGAGGGDDGGDLGRVMTVVVYDHDAVFFPEALESPLGALELRQRGGDGREGDADLEADGHGRERVQQVVPARHLQAQLAQFDVAPFECRRHRRRHPPASSTARPRASRTPRASFRER